MRKMIRKMRWIKVTRWSDLTTGERILRVVMALVKLAVIGALVAVLVSGLLAVIVGVVVGLGMMGAVAGGFTNASRAYKPGDRYVRFW